MWVFKPTFHIKQGFLQKNTWRLRILNVGVEVNQGLMEVAEGFVLLTDLPGFAREADMHDIFCVLSVILLVHIDSRLLDWNTQR